MNRGTAVRLGFIVAVLGVNLAVAYLSGGTPAALETWGVALAGLVAAASFAALGLAAIVVIYAWRRPRG